MGVVPGLEVGGEAIDLVERLEEPDQPEGGLLERPEHPLDAAVRPGVSRAGECRLDAVVGQKLPQLDGGEGRPAVAQDPQRLALFGERPPENARNLPAARPSQPLKRDDAAAAVVDGAQDPDGDEPQEPDHREVEAPELPRAGDLDAPRLAPPLLIHGNDESAAADQYATDGLARCREGVDALDEEAELAGAEERLLDVQADEFLFEVLRRAVPGPAATMRVGWRRAKTMASQPPASEPSERAVPAADAPGETLPEVVDGDGEPEETPDCNDASPIESAKDSTSPRGTYPIGQFG